MMVPTSLPYAARLLPVLQHRMLQQAGRSSDVRAPGSSILVKRADPDYCRIGLLHRPSLCDQLPRIDSALSRQLRRFTRARCDEHLLARERDLAGEAAGLRVAPNGAAQPADRVSRRHCTSNWRSETLSSAHRSMGRSPSSACRDEQALTGDLALPHSRRQPRLLGAIDCPQQSAQAACSQHA